MTEEAMANGLPSLAEEWRPRSDSNRRTQPGSSRSVSANAVEIEPKGFEPEFAAPTFASVPANTTDIERLLAKFLSKIEIDPSHYCAGEPGWKWTDKPTSVGYGRFFTGIPGATHMAHRWSYELLVGPIPDGLVIDHLCRVRHCVNPTHLEVVTDRVNLLRGEGFGALNARKTHCRNGHPFDEANTFIDKAGRRKCRTCRVRGGAFWRDYRARRKVAGRPIKQYKDTRADRREYQREWRARRKAEGRPIRQHKEAAHA